MTKYVVTDLGPIDSRPPGTDVTGVYDAATLARLIDEGYIAEDAPKAAQKPRKRPTQADSAADNGEDVTDGE